MSFKMLGLQLLSQSKLVLLESSLQLQLQLQQSLVSPVQVWVIWPT